MTRTRLLALALLGGVAAVGAWLWWHGPGAARRALARHPRIVLVTLDTLHVDFTGVVNPAVDYTPELDRLAAGGTVMVQARTTVPMTLPAHTSLLSGRTPLSLGVLSNGSPVAAEIETLPQVLRAAGYRTAAFLSLGTLRKEFGLDRGFEVYEDGYGTVPRFYRTADEVYAGARGWLDSVGDEPYFLWVHLSDPHEPYALVDAPVDTVVDLDGVELARYALVLKERHELAVTLPPGRHRLRWTSLRRSSDDDLEETSLRLQFRDNTDLASYIVDWSAIPSPDVGLEEPFVLELENRSDSPRELHVKFDGALRKPPPSEVRAQYAAEIAYVDEYLGKLRRAVEAEGREALWVVVSDHGEGVYRRADIIGHAGFGLEDQLRILWLMHGPGVPAGRRLEREAALIHDVAPTLLDVLGLSGLGDREGLSFVPCWSGGDCPDGRQWAAHGFNRPRAEISAVAVYRWPLKLLQQEADGSGAYDLTADPWETTDLAAAPDAELALELRRLGRDLQEVGKLLERRLASADEDLSEEDLDILRSLGYLGN